MAIGNGQKVRGCQKVGGVFEGGKKKFGAERVGHKNICVGGAKIRGATKKPQKRGPLKIEEEGERKIFDSQKIYSPPLRSF